MSREVKLTEEQLEYLMEVAKYQKSVNSDVVGGQLRLSGTKSVQARIVLQQSGFLDVKQTPGGVGKPKIMECSITEDGLEFLRDQKTSTG